MKARSGADVREGEVAGASSFGGPAEPGENPKRLTSCELPDVYILFDMCF